MVFHNSLENHWEETHTRLPARESRRGMELGKVGFGKFKEVGGQWKGASFSAQQMM
jgi:hypothetical protein